MASHVLGILKTFILKNMWPKYLYICLSWAVTKTKWESSIFLCWLQLQFYLRSQLVQLSFLFITTQTTPGPFQNMGYITLRCRATTCHECTVIIRKLRLNLGGHIRKPLNVWNAQSYNIQNTIFFNMGLGGLLLKHAKLISDWGVS